MQRVLVNKIIPSSVVDGPGNRAAIFLQGCNYTCKYCHNPETISVCQNCGACEEACPTGALTLSEGLVRWQESLCCGCDTCIHVCPHLSSPRVWNASAEEIMERLEPAIPFIRGITVSGGECSLQRDFLVELFERAKKRGLSTLMDSNGSYDYTADQELMEVCDGVMLDVKAFDDQAHLALTGKSSAPVLRNAVSLAQAGKLEEIRTVIVPEELPNEETVDQITRLLAFVPGGTRIRYKLIAYRSMGVRPPFQKTFRSPTAAEMEHCKKIAERNGVQNIVLI